MNLGKRSRCRASERRRPPAALKKAQPDAISPLPEQAFLISPCVKALSVSAHRHRVGDLELHDARTGTANAAESCGVRGRGLSS